MAEEMWSEKTGRENELVDGAGVYQTREKNFFFGMLLTVIFFRGPE